MANRKKDSYEIIIQPSKSWFYIDWQGLAHYKDLLFLLVWRDFVSKYKQTILGPLWFIIQPLLMMCVFTVIFHRVANIPTDSLPPTLFYLCGIVIWDYFARSLNGTSTSLIDNVRIFGKVYFPRLIVPLSIVISNLIAFSMQFVLFLGFYVYYKFFTAASSCINPNVMLAVLPLVLLHAALLSLGSGLWLASLTAKYRDLRFVMPFVIQMWMYGTPVIYSASIIPEKWQFILAINPMAAVVETFRYAFFGASAVNTGHMIISICTTIFMLVSGILIFNKIEKTFVDVI